MFKKKFEEYEKKMNAIEDPVALKKAMQANEAELSRKAKLPIYGGVSGSAASIALFVLTGILSGWTVGVLWVVATIMGAGVLASVTGAAVARHKYSVFKRAMRNRAKLQAMQEAGRDHDAVERAKTEQRLNKDLSWLQRKRVISTRERNVYGSSIGDAAAAGGGVYEAQVERMQQQAAAYNAAMDNLASDIRETIEAQRASDEAAWDQRADNISPDATFAGFVRISSQSRNTVTGEPCVDAEGKPVFDKYAQIGANSDKEIAAVLLGISATLKRNIERGVMPFPIKIEAAGLGDVMVDAWGEDGLVITNPNGTILREGGNQLETLASEIFSRLPICDTPPSEEHEEETDRDGPEDEAGHSADGAGAEAGGEAGATPPSPEGGAPSHEDEGMSR